MRLSTKGRYGVMAMYQLARSYQNPQAVSLKNIANTLNYSEAYLEQLFANLKKDRLVFSKRGPKGGYVLSRPPDQITVGEIIRSLEGPIEISSCVGEESGSFSCENSSLCVTKVLWEKINDSINSVIDHITLEDMLNEYKKPVAAGKGAEV